MPIQWRNEMSVGNTTIDDEHKGLIGLVNEIEGAIEQGSHKSEVKKLVEKLIQYTKEHFAHEEVIQIKIKYPRYMEHKLEHQELVEKVQALYEHITTQQPAPVVEEKSDAGQVSEAVPDEDGAIEINLDDSLTQQGCAR